MNKCIYFCFILLFTISCNNSNPEVHKVLDLSGDNKEELLKVLDHYSHDLSDSLKLKAAIFLIENLPYQYSINGNKVSNYISEIYSLQQNKNLPAWVAVDSVESKYGRLSDIDFFRVDDIGVVTSDYLIKNIDLAFHAWQSSSWYNSISFDTFCQSILPYRIENEPISNWRQIFYDRYKPIIDSLQPVNYFAATQVIYDELINEKWNWTAKLGIPGIDAATIFSNRIGECKEQARLVVYAMRSVGIPVNLDLHFQNPKGATKAHYWNSIEVENGSTVEFILESGWRPMIGLKDTTRKKGVVYRYNYVPNKNIENLSKLSYNSQLKFTNPLISNVSDEYFSTSVTIPLEESLSEEDSIYLSVFNNSNWVPIALCKILDGNVELRNIEPNILYSLCLYSNNEIFTINTPFTVDTENNYRNFIPESQFESIEINRKFPLSNTLRKYKTRALGGKFQISSDAQFTDPLTFFEITEDIDIRYYRIILPSVLSARYIRYLSAPNGYNNMAEISFYDQDGCPLTGKIIGSDIRTFKTKLIKTKEATFDGDPLTFFDADKPSGLWTGLDFGVNKEVASIEFLFRNDDNMVRENDLYELFYFTKDGLLSLGKQKGIKNQPLLYHNIPKGALLLLHNHTRGKEERPFTITKEGEQEWW